MPVVLGSHRVGRKLARTVGIALVASVLLALTPGSGVTRPWQAKRSSARERALDNSKEARPCHASPRF